MFRESDGALETDTIESSTIGLAGAVIEGTGEEELAGAVTESTGEEALAGVVTKGAGKETLIGGVVKSSGVEAETVEVVVVLELVPVLELVVVALIEICAGTFIPTFQQ